MPEKNYDFYKQLLSIDKGELDKVCITQPFVFQEVSCKVANAKAVLDSLKLEKDTMEAQCKQDIRAEALKSGSKVTEGSIMEKVSCDTDCLQANREVIGAKEEYNLWSGLLEAYNQRASMLKLVVRLLETDLYNIKNNSMGTEEKQHEAARQLVATNRQPRRRRPQ